MQAFRQAFCSVALLFVPLCLASSQSFAQTSVDSLETMPFQVATNARTKRFVKALTDIFA